MVVQRPIGQPGGARPVSAGRSKVIEARRRRLMRIYGEHSSDRSLSADLTRVKLTIIASCVPSPEIPRLSTSWWDRPVTPTNQIRSSIEHKMRIHSSSACLDELTDGLTDGRVDGRTDGQTDDRRKDRWTDRRTDGQMDGRTTDGRMGGLSDGRTDGCTYEWTVGQTDGRMDG